MNESEKSDNTAEKQKKKIYSRIGDEGTLSAADAVLSGSGSKKGLA